MSRKNQLSSQKMDVDRYNYSSMFEDFKASVERCNFYALDHEMTGVNDTENPQSGTMKLSEVYEVSRNVVSRYVAIQLGVSLFTRVEGGYEVKPYNFYLLKDSGDFAVSVDALRFLGDHHMDFQRWLRTGIPYGSSSGKECRTRIGQGPFCSLQGKLSDCLVRRVKEWYNNASTKEGDTFNFSAIMCEGVEQRALSALEKDNIFVSFEYCKLNSFGSPVSVTVRLLASGGSCAGGGLSDVCCVETSEVNGFHGVWECLTSCKKPVVGHNFWLDILFMIQMHEGPLPGDYNSFKILVHQLFPCIYDTKTLGREIIANNSLESFCLKDLYDKCLASRYHSGKTLNFFFPRGFDRYSQECFGGNYKAHEAGYDSFMTGVVFAVCKDLYCIDKCGLGRWQNIVSVYGSYFYMSVDGKDYLMKPATFVVEFVEEVEYPLGELLVCGGTSMWCVGGDGLQHQDCAVSYDRIKGLCNTIIVQFESDICESDVQTLIENSLCYWSRVTKELMNESMTFPQILKIYRLGE